MPILEGKNLTRAFGGLIALKEVNLEVQPHEILGIIGPNGAGKTTCFNVLTGFYPPTSGDVFFDGRRSLPPPWKNGPSWEWSGPFSIRAFSRN